jgi:hypothetical protein
MAATTASWSAQEQAALQSALRLFPASLAKDERWQRIAQHVGRSTRDCVARYKEIAAEIQARGTAGSSAGAPDGDGVRDGAPSGGGAANGTAAAADSSGSAGAPDSAGVRNGTPGGGSGAIVGIVRHAPAAAAAAPRAPITLARENLMSPRLSNDGEDELDPISLEPLADLPYPPFILPADPTRSSQNDAFDGNMLASCAGLSTPTHHYPRLAHPPATTRPQHHYPPQHTHNTPTCHQPPIRLLPRKLAQLSA